MTPVNLQTCHFTRKFHPDDWDAFKYDLLAWSLAITSGSPSFSCKRSCHSRGLCEPQLYRPNSKAATGDVGRSECGCILIKRYQHTLRFELSVDPTCHEALFFPFFPSIQKCKNHSWLVGCSKQVAGWTWPRSYSLLTPKFPSAS